MNIHLNSQDKSSNMWVVFVSSFPPRQCGIATFTADLVEHFDQQFEPREETKVIALNTQSDADLSYSDKVIAQISENSIEDYLSVAQKINEMDYVKLVSIQHEYGLFGDNDGEHAIPFIQAIQKPVIVTLHTVLPEPSENQKRIMCSIAEKADRIVVMTHSSAKLLTSIYGADPEKVKIVPHGIHARPYTFGRRAKKEFGLEGKKVLSTFGLLNRGKGIEFALEALPRIVKEHPDVVYAIIGATHPVVLRREGPVYINSLKEMARKLGIEKNVVFFDKYVETSELLRMLQASDIYLSLSQNPAQAVSGTLTYALGMGRPVISTPFEQAKEILTPDVGLLAEFGNSSSIADAVLTLLNDSERLTSMSRCAYFKTRSMTWDNVALSYMREFKKLSPELALKEKSIPAVNLDHLKRMTDDFGIFQFAILTDPDPQAGYTIDDNARALVAVIRYARFLKTQEEVNELFGLAGIYLGFLEYAAHTDGPGFKNYFNADHFSNEVRNTTENLQDANARATWSLAILATCTDERLPDQLKDRARILLEKQYVNKLDLTSPRAMAFHIKALALMITDQGEQTNQHAQSEYKNILIQYADVLVDLYTRSSGPDWLWFEDHMTYSNALLSEALLRAYVATGNEEYKRIGKESLDFLVENSFSGDVCVPVGQNGWFKQGGTKRLYDQQPEEVSALVLALQIMFEVSDDKTYLNKKELAFDWFLGNNMLDQVIYSQMSGGCYDGIGEGYINLNQGAESTISYLLARVSMELQ
ncbi:MAG: glycosyltransferase [Candidatus Pacebacteria bacterium]|nr:glycosyltransferase [Candidatus Paceibacterota bacterium]